MAKKRIKAPKHWEDPPESFERFKALAKGLMAVPKKELDRELAKHEPKKTASVPPKRKH